MKFNPVRRLTPFEKEFCELYRLTGGQKAFPVKTALLMHDPEKLREYECLKTKLSSRIQQVADKLLAREDIQAYLAFLDLPASEIADVVVSEGLLSADTKTQLATAKAIQQREEKEGARDAASRWLKLMRETGHEIVVPVPSGAKEVAISLEDLAQGRAHIRGPLSATVELLHRAGAPWSEDFPDAKLSPLQIEILGRRERTMVLHGGSGVGKSVLGGCFSLGEVSMPRREIAIIAGTYEHCANEFMYVYAGFLQLYGRAAATRIVFANAASHHDMEIQTIWGSRVRCFSTDREQGQAVLGKEFDLAVLGEGSHVSPDIFDRKIKRALDRRIKVIDEETGYYRPTGRAIIFTTPKGYDGCSSSEWDRVTAETKGKFEEMHEGMRPWLETVYLREADCCENPAYSKEVYEARRRTLPADVFAEQYEGKRTRRSGLVYKEFEYSQVVVPELPPAEFIRTLRLGFAMDTGKHFAGGLAGIDREGHKHFLGEVYTCEESIIENCTHIKELCLAVLGPVFSVSEWDELVDYIELWRIDPSSQHELDVIENLDVPLTFDKLGLISSIDHVREEMQNRRVHFYQEHFNEATEGGGLFWEIGRYQWASNQGKAKQTKAATEPIKRDDHAMDWMRYLAHALDEAGPPEIEEMPDNSYEGMIRAMREEQRRAMLAGMRGEDSQITNIGEAYRAVHDL